MRNLVSSEVSGVEFLFFELILKLNYVTENLSLLLVRLKEINILLKLKLNTNNKTCTKIV